MAAEACSLLSVSRRDFLKYSGWVAAAIGSPGITGAEVAEALEFAMTRRPVVVWTTFQACTGCAVQILQSRKPTVANLILKQISLEYQDNVMAAAGRAAEEHLEEVTSEDFYWVVEGSIPTDPREATMIGGRTAAEIAEDLYPKAAATIAHGSCACYGNIQASDPNPTNAMGLTEFLRTEGGVADPAVINMSRCPGHGEDLITALSYVLVTGEVPPLDPVGRPTFLYGQTIHDTCFRRGQFDAGTFAEAFGDEGWNSGACLYKVGCKGPVTYAPCGVSQWNGNVSWCVQNAPCQGCAEPDFWDAQTPFHEQVPGIHVPGVGNVSAEKVGIGLGIATAVGLGIHAVGQVATGRMGKGGPAEKDTGGDR
ncbi:MAG: hydrogenase small subunit [Coriobacteriia bacterium]